MPNERPRGYKQLSEYLKNGMVKQVIEKYNAQKETFNSGDLLEMQLKRIA